VKPERAIQAVIDVALQTVGDAAKGNLLPRNLVGADKGDFQAFSASQICGHRKATPVKKMDLIDVGNADHRKRRINDDVRSGFLKCFPACPLGSGFAVFHEPRRQGPVAKLWFNGASAEEYPVFPTGYAANDKAGVFVMNVSTDGANMARQGVAVWHDKAYIGAAEVAVSDHDNFHPGNVCAECTTRVLAGRLAESACLAVSSFALR